MQGVLRWLRQLPGSRVAGVAISCVSLVGLLLFVSLMGRSYPLRDWLAWPLGMIWGWVALSNAAWLSFGQLLLVRVFKQRTLPVLESMVLSVALGVVAFAELSYLGGMLHAFGPAFAVLLPVLMLAVGARDLRALLQRARDERVLAAVGGWPFVVTAAGALCVGLIYLGVMTPDALNYDSTWQHLTTAQDYAREGRLVRFPGDYNKCVPHLASLLHVYDFSVPGLTPQLRWMLALHQEFVLFLWTLAGVSAAVRWLTGDDTLRGAWVGFFLFPTIFIYDNNLGGAADHVLAFFAIPVLLSSARFWEAHDVRRGALFGCMLGGALLTKYQAVYLIGPLGVLLGARWAWLTLAALRAGRVELQPRLAALWLPLLAFVASFVLIASPHFVKNFIYYNNPVYPFMQRVFTHSSPTTPTGAYYFDHVFTDLNWVPQGSLVEKLVHAFKLLFSFSFEPHYSFTKNVPSFGSMFTLLMPLALLVKHRRRKLYALSIGIGALLLWGLTFNVDRNLQAFLPVLAATSCALLVDGFRSSKLAWIGLLPLTLLHVIWGVDAYFYSSHDRMRASIDLIRSGYEGHAEQRFDGYRASYVAVSKVLPANAKVLLHTSHVSLGIDRELVLDWEGFQGLISYAKPRTARELYDDYRRLGITHIVYSPGATSAPTKQEEVLFAALIEHTGKPLPGTGGLRVLRMPKVAPPQEAPYSVATLGIAGYRDGVFAIEHMSTHELLIPGNLKRFPQPDAPLGELTAPAARDASNVRAVLVGAGANVAPEVRALLDTRFRVAVSYSGRFTLYLRKRPSAAGR